MKYEIEFTDDFERRTIMGPLPEDLVQQINSNLAYLANDPQTHSKRPEPPDPPVGRVCEMELVHANTLYRVSFYFVFSQDEKRLIVRRSKMQPPFRPDPPIIM